MNFDVAFNRLIGHEGGYVNNPDDPGGETKWGISKRSYPHLDIAGLTREEAREIYLLDFWHKIYADQMPFSLAFQAFDFAVNSGIGTAIRYLQRALGVADDGYWGPITREAAMRSNEAAVIMRLSAYRLKFMTRLNNWPNASRGWSRRIADNLLIGVDDLLYNQGVDT